MIINLTDEQFQALKALVDGYNDCDEIFAEHMPIDEDGHSMPTGHVIAIIPNVAPDESPAVEVATFDDIDEADRFVDALKVLQAVVQHG